MSNSNFKFQVSGSECIIRISFWHHRTILWDNIFQGLTNNCKSLINHFSWILPAYCIIRQLASKNIKFYRFYRTLKTFVLEIKKIICIIIMYFEFIMDLPNYLVQSWNIIFIVCILYCIRGKSRRSFYFWRASLLRNKTIQNEAEF